MERFRRVFTGVVRAGRPAVIGMVHVQALPGTPKHRSSLSETVERACQEAELYRNYGLDGVMVENMHDLPYLRRSVGPEVVSAMTVVCREVKKVVGGLPVGVQILSGANQEAVAIAHSSGAQFIRAEGYVFSHISDEGWMDSCAGELLRYRRMIGAEDVLIFTDIKKKHSSHAVTEDVSLSDTAQAAEFFLSDGVIVTGKATGDPASHEDILSVKESVAIPVLIGSGASATNLHTYSVADAIIVGSYFKENSKWCNSVKENKVAEFMGAFHNMLT